MQRKRHGKAQRRSQDRKTNKVKFNKVKIITAMRTKHYKTLNGLFKAYRGEYNYDYYLRGTCWINGRNYKITMSDELRDKVLNLFASAIWERGAASKAWKLENVKSCGILRRVMINKYNGKFYASYCAGQDYPSEIKFIQNWINTH